MMVGRKTGRELNATLQQKNIACGVQVSILDHKI